MDFVSVIDISEFEIYLEFGACVLEFAKKCIKVEIEGQKKPGFQ